RLGERLQPLTRSFHLYHNRPINKTAKFGGERAANARNNIALAHLHSASLHCRGRRTRSASLRDSLTPKNKADRVSTSVRNGLVQYDRREYAGGLQVGAKEVGVIGGDESPGGGGRGGAECLPLCPE